MSVSTDLQKAIIKTYFMLFPVALPCLFLVLYGKPYERGFFEADQSIRLPYREETVPEAILTPVAFTIVVVMVSLTLFICCLMFLSN